MEGKSMIRLPLGQWVNDFVEWLLLYFGNAFDRFSAGFLKITDFIGDGLELLPWYIIIAIFALLCFKAKGWRLALGAVIGLTLIYNLNLWPAFLETLLLVIISTFISLIIGIPLGILGAKKDGFHKVLSPILDFMQTMPSFVYLIPAL